MKKTLFCLMAVLMLLSMVSVSCDREYDITLNTEAAIRKLASPSGLKAVIGDGNVAVSWNPVPDADYYEIYRRDFNAEGQLQTAFMLIGNVTAGVNRQTVYQDVVGYHNPLEAGVRYDYAVMARRATSHIEDDVRYTDSDLSGAVSVTLETVPAQGSALAAPATVMVSDAGFKRYIYWDMVENASSYAVYKIDADSPDYANMTTLSLTSGLYGAVIVDADPTDTSLITDVEAGNFAYAVIAKKADGYLLASAPASASIEVNADLDTPANLAVVANDIEGTIIISWDDVACADSYTVYRSTACDGAYAAISVTPEYYGNTATWVAEDNTAQVNITYYYKVVAQNTAGQISYATAAVNSKITQSSSLAAPTNLTATDGVYGDRIALEWDAVDEATDYTIYRKGEDDDFFTEVSGLTLLYRDLDNKVLTYDDGALLAGVDANNYVYTYKIMAVNTAKSLRSPFSATATGYILPNGESEDSLAAPVVAALQAGTFNGFVKIQWQRVAGAESYDIYVSQGDEAGVVSTTGYFLVAQVTDGAADADASPEAGYDQAYAFGQADTPNDDFLFEPGIQYNFVLVSVDDDAFSQSRHSALSTAAASYLNALNQPTITATNVNATTVDIAFDSNSETVYGDVTYTVRIGQQADYDGDPQAGGASLGNYTEVQLSNGQTIAHGEVAGTYVVWLAVAENNTTEESASAPVGITVP